MELGRHALIVSHREFLKKVCPGLAALEAASEQMLILRCVPRFLGCRFFFPLPLLRSASLHSGAVPSPIFADYVSSQWGTITKPAKVRANDKSF